MRGDCKKLNKDTETRWNLVNRATTWLNNNDYTNPVQKWDTNNWEEIHADFGRKNKNFNYV